MQNKRRLGSTGFQQTGPGGDYFTSPAKTAFTDSISATLIPVQTAQPGVSRNLLNAKHTTTPKNLT